MVADSCWILDISLCGGGFLLDLGYLALWWQVLVGSWIDCGGGEFSYLCVGHDAPVPWPARYRSNRIETIY